MRRRTPKEKKELSLTKDRRNVYGEAPHGARKSIPLQKKLRNRANRHSQDVPLRVAPKELNVDEADKVESAIYSKAPKQWEKSPDAPLGDVITGKQLRRKRSHGRKGSRKSIV
jgi:hypothetical protein